MQIDPTLQTLTQTFTTPLLAALMYELPSASNSHPVPNIPFVTHKITSESFVVVLVHIICINMHIMGLTTRLKQGLLSREVIGKGTDASPWLL